MHWYKVISTIIILKIISLARGCQNLPKPENGNVEVTSTVVGTVATYSCNDGFKLVGNENRVCRPNGQWSGVAPSCQGEETHLP